MGNEFFAEQNGRKVDAFLHEEVLREDDMPVTRTPVVGKLSESERARLYEETSG